jgi:hypothetical protein
MPPFAKGYDPRRNLKGRPKLGQSIAERCRAFMQEIQAVQDPKTKKRFRVERIDAFLAACYAESIKGNAPYAKLLWNYHDGLPPFRGVISTPDDEDEADLDSLTDQELLTLSQLLRKAGARGPVRKARGKPNRKPGR